MSPTKQAAVMQRSGKGLTIERKYTTEGKDPLAGVIYEKRTSVIKNTDGTKVFEIKDVEVPAFWTQVATDILAQKYFRKTGVPQLDAQGDPMLDEEGKIILGPERSVRQVASRLAGCWRHWGEKHGYFASEKDAQAFEDELVYMLVYQICAPNSPQWFNTGLAYKYGITGSPQGHWYVDPDTAQLKLSDDAYTRPQPHACADYYTQVYTAEGTKFIGEIVEKNLVGLPIFDGEKYVKILATKYNGKKQVYKISLKNGNFVELTEDHLVYSSAKRHKDGGKYSWNYVKDLAVGSKMQQPLVFDVKEKNVFVEDLAKARLAGWVVGDGVVGVYDNVMRLEIITVNEDEHNAVLADIREVFGEEVSYWVTDFKTEDVSLQGKRIHLSGRKLSGFVQEYSLADKRSITATVPQKIVTGAPQEKREFLKALFQADGCVRIRVDETRNSGDICLATSSERLAFDTLQLLNSLGIYARISKLKEKRENRVDGNHVIIAYGSAREQYEEQVGFISSDKADMLLILNHLVSRSKSLPLIREETIVNIEPVEVRDVYDIQTESEKFLGNGLVLHNCFIQSVNDDLVNEGGIFDLVTREARIFKYGSGTGTNFSNIRSRSEGLSGGGRSSGLMSFLKINDRAAGAIKSGGTTRRAAKMVCLDLDHPEVEDFIDWKMIEEQKVADLVSGSKNLKATLSAITEVATRTKDYDLKTNKELRNAVRKAMDANVPLSFIGRTLQLCQQGVADLMLHTYDTHFEGEAYNTVSGQNSNNSIRIPNKFFFSLQNDGEWKFINRVDKKVAKTVKAKDLWQRTCYAAWASADPGMQYDDTINEWHTCPEDGRINASNPCSEYMFLDDTACNLASINLVKFLDEENDFDIEKYKHVSRLWTVVLEVSVLMAQFPSREIARLSYDFRTLGLGYANLGTVLMRSGIPYDSDKARGIAGALTAIMCGESYAISAEMAQHLGPFPGFPRNREHMLRVMRNHRRAAHDAQPDEYEGLTITPMGINSKNTPKPLLEAARASWDRAVELGEKHGYRNAQVTVIAPTGTIGLVMDCDTTGVEPDFALVKFKKLAGGGYFKIVNQSVPAALRTLGYSKSEIDGIIAYAIGHGTLKNCPGINHESLLKLGFPQETIDLVEKQLPSAFQLNFALNVYTVGKELLLGLGLTQEQLSDPNLNVLAALGFTPEEIRVANDYVCGTMTVEGAPHLEESDYPVFDCANRCGSYGKRYIAYDAHIKMMAAVQPFISGAISKTINMPKEAQIVDISDAYIYGWKVMLKAVALYRDGCKLCQPLNSTASDLDAELLALQSETDIDEMVTPETVQQIMLETHRRMPMRRRGFTQEAEVGGHKVVVKTGEYDDGSLGELHIEMYKEGASFRGLMNGFAGAVTTGLQHGVPLEHYVEAFTFTRFEPSGIVAGDQQIKQATSVLDYVFRVLGNEYLGREDLVHVKNVQHTHTVPVRTAVHTPKPIDASSQKISDAKKQGYIGEACGQCASMKVKQNGSCAVCLDCGTTTGCS